MAASVQSPYTPIQSRALPFHPQFGAGALHHMHLFGQQQQQLLLPQQQAHQFSMRSPTKFLQPHRSPDGTPTSVVKFVYPAPSPLSNDMTNNQFRPTTPMGQAPQHFHHHAQLQQHMQMLHFQAQAQAEAQARQAAGFQLHQQQQQHLQQLHNQQQLQQLQQQQSNNTSATKPSTLKQRRPRSRSLGVCTAQDALTPTSPRMVGASNTMVELANENEPIWQQLNQSLHNFIDTTLATTSEKLSSSEVDAIRRAFLAGARTGMDDENEGQTDLGADGSSNLAILLQAARTVASFRGSSPRTTHKRRTCEEPSVFDSSIFKRIKTAAAAAR